MNPLLRNFGPLAGFITIVGWLCWEQLQPPAAPQDLGSEKIVRLDQDLLNPELPKPCKRNPLAPAAPSVAAAAVAETAWQPVAKLDEQPSAGVTQASKYKLRGTYIGGVRKSALIDDQICFEGDCLPGAAESCRLTQVEQDYVVVRIADEDVRLEYSP